MKDSENIASSGISKTWSERRKGGIVIVMSLIGIFALVFWMSMKSRSMLAAPAELAVSEKELDIGEVWEQPAFPCKITIQNTGTKDIVIDKFNSSCGCVSVEPTPLTIPARGKDDIRVTLNMTLRPDQESTDFNVQIVPILRDETRAPPAWMIRGRSKKLLKLQPAKISFYGKELVQDHPYPSLTAIATAMIPLDLLAVKSSPDLASVQVVPSKHSPNAFEITITPSKALPAGSFRFEIVLEPQRSGAVYPNQVLPVEGRITSDVHALPDSLVFGPGKTGETLTECVTLRSASGMPFKLEKIDISSPDIAVEAGSVPGAAGKSFRVLHKVSRAGTQSSSVRFTVRNDKGKESIIEVKVVCLAKAG